MVAVTIIFHPAFLRLAIVGCRHILANAGSRVKDDSLNLNIFPLLLGSDCVLITPAPTKCHSLPLLIFSFFLKLTMSQYLLSLGHRGSDSSLSRLWGCTFMSFCDWEPWPPPSLPMHFVCAPLDTSINFVMLFVRNTHSPDSTSSLWRRPILIFPVKKKNCYLKAWNKTLWK